MGSRPARWNPPPTRVRLAIAIGLATATLWLAFLAANGPAIRPDTKAYLRVADGFWSFRILTSSRLPGYPLFLVAGRGVASLLATDVATTVAVAQILLLSGLGTALVFTLACRMTGRTAIGFAAALLFAFDVDVQWFGAALLTEALVVTLVLLMAAVRLRDGRWVRASWLLAALALIRPNFAAFPVAFAVFDALRLRTLRALLAPLLPTVAVWAAWWVIASAAGADPSRPQSWFVPIHTFTKVYEGDLWRALPDGPERRLIAEQRAHHVDVMDAAAAVDEASGPGSIRRVAQSAIRADPLGYVRLCLAPCRSSTTTAPGRRSTRWASRIRGKRSPARASLPRALPRDLLRLSLAVRRAPRARVPERARLAARHPDLPRPDRPVRRRPARERRLLFGGGAPDRSTRDRAPPVQRALWAAAAGRLATVAAASWPRPREERAHAPDGATG